MGALAARGIAANFLQVRFLHPFPSEGVARILGSARRAVLVENNATGQLGDLIAQKALVRIPLRVLRCNGRMFMADELAAEIEAALS
ncbi:MAG: hypothetical protein MUC63_10905 [Planctomycetes bacterium]|nr:hypothetical protein [Planctomycetota bacterium]